MNENKLIKGYWINGILGGTGCEIGSDYIYLGYFVDNEKNGCGTQIWDDEAKYQGEWKDNKFEGYGIYYYPDGKIYMGQWSNSYKNGFGELIWPDGKKYVGFYLEDQKDGFGIYYIKKYCFIISFWKNGKRHGLGKYIKGEQINYQNWINNELINENMNEVDFMNSFTDDIKKYRFIFKMNINDILKFMNINI